MRADPPPTVKLPKGRIEGFGWPPTVAVACRKSRLPEELSRFVNVWQCRRQDSNLHGYGQPTPQA